jgi:hypothetical protein
MTKRHWLAATCAVGLLAAGPAFAQGQPAGGAAPGTQADTGAPSPAQPRHKAWHTARNSATSQDAAVDRLNDQSLQAAQQGRSFDLGNPGSSGAGSSGAGSPGGSGGAGSMPQPAGGGKM